MIDDRTLISNLAWCAFGIHLRRNNWEPSALGWTRNSKYSSDDAPFWQHQKKSVYVAEAIAAPILSGGGDISYSIKIVDELDHDIAGDYDTTEQPDATTLDSIKQETLSVWGGVYLRVQRAVAPMLEYPRAGDLDHAAGLAAKVVTELMGASPPVEDAGVGRSLHTRSDGEGRLAESILKTQRVSDSFGGGAFDDFVRVNITHLGQPARAITSVASLLEQAIAAEQNVWRAYQKDLSDLIVSFTTAFMDQSQNGSNSGAKVAFSIIGAAAAGLASFFSGGVAAVFGSVSILAGLSKDIESESSRKEFKFSDLEEALLALESALRKLEGSLTAEQSSISDSLKKNAALIRGASADFQLSPVAIRSGEGQNVYVENVAKARSVALTLLPDVAGISETQAEVCTRPASEYVNALLAHDVTIGLGFEGIGQPLFDVALILRELLREFAWDVRRAGKNLAVAFDDYEQVGNRTKARIAQLAADLESTETYDGGLEDDLVSRDAPVQETVLKNLRRIMK